MRAIVLSGFGGTEVLQLEERPDPSPGPGHLVVAVHAAGVNPVDIGNRIDGAWAGVNPGWIPGYDVAGVIEELGAGLSGASAQVAVGDRVMAMLPFPDGGGGYAERAVIDAHHVARIADGVSFVEAAGLPLAGTTAIQVLRRLRLPPGSRVLVLGASGGVGTLLVQFAAAAGLDVIAVGGAGSHDLLRRLGARHCIDYRTTDVAHAALDLAGGPVDAAIDLYGGSLLAETLPAVRRKGQLASIATPVLDLDPVIDANQSFHGVLVYNDPTAMAELGRQLERGLRAVVSATFPLHHVAEAHKLVETGHAGGKVLLTMDVDLP